MRESELRRRVVLSLTLLLLIGAGRASAQTITTVSAVTKSASQSGSSLLSQARTHVAGNLLVAALYHQDFGDTISGCTNTAGDTWAKTRATAFTATIGGTVRTVEIWYTATASTAASTPTGTIGATNDVVTCSLNAGNTYNGSVVYEFNKTSGTWGFVADSAASNNTGTSTLVSSGSLTLSNPSVIVSSFLVSANQTPTSATYTLTSSDGAGLFLWAERHITASSEAATATVTATSWIVLAAAFQASGAGATRGLFQVPSLGGLGIGGSFFRDPLQFVGLAGWAFAVLLACAVATHQTLTAVDQIHAHLTARQDAKTQAAARDVKLKAQMETQQSEAKQRELLKVRRG